MLSHCASRHETLPSKNPDAAQNPTQKVAVTHTRLIGKKAEYINGSIQHVWYDYT